MSVLEGDEPPRANSDLLARALFPGHVAFEDPGPHVERTLVVHQRGSANVERLVVNVEPNQRAVRGVDDRLSGSRITVGGLRIDDRPGLVERVDERALLKDRRALVEGAANAHVPVGQGKQRFHLRHSRGIELLLHQPPRIVRIDEGWKGLDFAPQHDR